VQYRSGDKTQKNEVGRACSTYGGGEVYTRFWWGNLREEHSFGRRRHRWEDNSKVYLQEVGWAGMDWILWLRIGTGGGHL
jgi:hypothetical protein